jgi:hypothetical protein
MRKAERAWTSSGIRDVRGQSRLPNGVAADFSEGSIAATQKTSASLPDLFLSEIFPTRRVVVKD